jgi:hypothetical protein
MSRLPPTAAVHAGARRRARSKPTRKPQRHQRAAPGAVGDAQAPAVRLDDLAAQCQSESRAGGLGGKKRQQRIPQRLLAQARAPIRHLQTKARRSIAHRDRDLLARRARFSRILQQVDHHLPELALIEVAGACGQLTGDPERHGALQPRQKLLPAHRRRPRPRQLGEASVAVDETGEVRGPLADGVEHPGQLGAVGCHGQQPPRVC